MNGNGNERIPTLPESELTEERKQQLINQLAEFQRMFRKTESLRNELDKAYRGLSGKDEEWFLAEAKKYQI
ncbi:MAG: hypothetical protein AAB897_00725 [Patescibacteria group bacterium]